MRLNWAKRPAPSCRSQSRSTAATASRIASRTASPAWVQEAYRWLAQSRKSGSGSSSSGSCWKAPRRAGQSRCSNSTSRQVRRCPFRTAMTATKRPCTGWRACSPGRWTACGTTSAWARCCASRAGAVHHFENHGSLDATNLAAVTPGVLSPAYFRELAALVGAAAGGPPDLAAMAEVMRRHGLTPARSRQ